MNRLRWILVAVAAAKGFDALTFGIGIAYYWLLAALILALNARVGALCLAVWALVGAGLDLARMSNHVVLIGWLGLILGLWDDDTTRLRLLRIQLLVLYAFAGFSKLNPVFLSGAYIEARQTGLPAPHVLAWLTIAIEWMLGLGVWRRASWALPLAVAFHGALTLGWTVRFWEDGPGILVFNVLVVTMVALVTPWPSWQSRQTAPARESQAIL